MIQFLVTVLSNATIYALIAVSINIIYRSSGILNFGAGYMVAFIGIAYANILPSDMAGISGSLVLGIMISLVAYWITVWWGQKSGLDRVGLSLGLLGFGMILDFTSKGIWGAEGFSASALISGTVAISGITFTKDRIAMLLLAVLFLWLMLWFIEKTMIGNALEATAEDVELAKLYGVRTGLASNAAWVLSGAAIGLGGVLQATYAAISMASSLSLVVIGIAAAVVGGLGSIQNAVIGSIIVAGIQTAFIQFISTRYSISMVFALLFLVLIFRPNGLFVNTRSVERV